MMSVNSAKPGLCEVLTVSSLLHCKLSAGLLKAHVEQLVEVGLGHVDW